MCVLFAECAALLFATRDVTHKMRVRKHDFVVADDVADDDVADDDVGIFFVSIWWRDGPWQITLSAS